MHMVDICVHCTHTLCSFFYVLGGADRVGEGRRNADDAALCLMMWHCLCSCDTIYSHVTGLQKHGGLLMLSES